MTNSIWIQFNAQAPNLDAVSLALRAVVPQVLSVEASRWVAIDSDTFEERDAGPRLDVEISYRAASEARPIIAAIVAFIQASPLVTQ